MKHFIKYPKSIKATTSAKRKSRVYAGSENVSYPTPEEIDALEADPDESSVEDAYYDQCIDAIYAGLDGYDWDSDTAGITIILDSEDDEFDDGYGESENAFISNRSVKELEIRCLRKCNNWADFHEALASYINEYV